MLPFRDPSLRAALLMGLRVLALVAVLGGAATLALLQLRPRAGDDAGSRVALPRVAAPVLLPPVAEPAPPAPRVPSAVPARVWLRDLGASPRALRLDAGGTAAGSLCSALGEAGWAMSGWSAGELDPSRRECIGERSFGAASGGEATNGFVILRGGAAGPLQELRVKLNLLDEASAAEATGELVRALETVFATLRWNLPAEVAEAVRSRRPIAFERAGMSLRFWREEGEVARWNLRLLVPEPPAPADRFTSGRAGLSTLGEAAPTPAP